MSASTEAADIHGKVPIRNPNFSTKEPAGFTNGEPTRASDLQPRYAQQITHDDVNVEAQGSYASFISGLGSFIGCFGAIPCCICCPNPFKRVAQGEVGLITKFGRFERSVDPGLVRVNPLSEHLATVDVKIQFVEVPRQVCMTKDNVTLNLSSVIYYQIVSPHKAVFGITNVRQALVERTQTTLRHVIGARVLQDVVERREEIAQSTAEIIEEVASGWGVQVESMLIKDMIFSTELQESLSMAAQSRRIGESKVIAARAEVESAKLMRQAADILSSAPAMQIRYLESMQAMAKTANSKVIFLPAMNQTIQQQFGATDNAGEGPSNAESGQVDDSFQRAINAQIIENI